MTMANLLAYLLFYSQDPNQQDPKDNTKVILIAQVMLAILLVIIGIFIMWIIFNRDNL